MGRAAGVWDSGERDRDGRAFGERAESGDEAAVAEDCWVDPARELAQLVERLRELAVGCAEERFRLLGVSLQGRLDEPQLERERDEPLLRPVVQISLQPPALGVGRLDDPRS